jgi:hypothetical protein
MSLNERLDLSRIGRLVTDIHQRRFGVMKRRWAPDLISVAFHHYGAGGSACRYNCKVAVTPTVAGRTV